ncbi:hypothetical protein BUALT_Bualt03G0019200 [Buddleja alternifolia]|uniref:C3H1-type domain-containing protein n=1 Tax=Buddleja alternifolia TaxID=168488 RepID=A0AAV6XYS9_9LAMI|nr:hypothetical protein BUALT_Bualt03G0019200 [Buddleja alternifolia]
MDDGEGGFSFDFEGGLDTAPTHPTASVPAIRCPADARTASAASANANIPSAVSVAASQATGGVGGGGRRSFRQTVCRHWLRSLCMKGDACGFLHQYDKSRMPVCRFFRLHGECREQDCVYKHTNEDIKECNMYKLGFCPNGRDCRYRHAKLPGPPPSVEEVLQKIQQMTSYNYGNSNRFFQNRNTNYSQQTEKSQFPQGPNGINQVGKVSTTESGNVPQQPQQDQQSQQQGNHGQILNFPHGRQNQASRAAAPLPQGTSRRASCSEACILQRQITIIVLCAQKLQQRESGAVCIARSTGTQRSNEAKHSEAFESVDNIILIFSVNKTRHFQVALLEEEAGSMLMELLIMDGILLSNGGSVGGGNWNHAHGTAHLWTEFCCQMVKELRNPYNENYQRRFYLLCTIGNAAVVVWLAAELKREEEKAKGVNLETMIPDGFPIRDLFGRPPFMGVGAQATGRAGRPVGMPSICPQLPQPPSHNLNRGKRGHKALAGDRSDVPGQGKSRGMAGSVGDENHSRREAHLKDCYRGGNSFKNVESESEDGAPRRSRHGREEEEETWPGG